jgi:lipoprotein-releasing system ATP-binding protein
MENTFDLTANNLYKNFSDKRNVIGVLQGITYSFCQNKSYAIMGASGTGKSTLMHLLAGLDRPSEGTVTLDTENIAIYSAKQRAQQLAFVVQSPTLIKELSVLENVMLAGILAGQSFKKSEQEAKTLLERISLALFADYKPGQLSGGQKQRIALARALMYKPKFLLADELTGNLDYQTSLDIMNFVLKLKKEWGIGLIISSHNHEIAAMMDVQLILKDSILIEQKR